MGKIVSVYKDNLDRVWYNSSNIFYSECDDKDNELKTLRITFKDGRTYEYKKVNVMDYLKFRELPSQGKAFNTLVKKYECERIDSKDISSLQKELDDLLEQAKEDNEEKKEEKNGSD